MTEVLFILGWALGLGFLIVGFTKLRISRKMQMAMIKEADQELIDTALANKEKEE